MRKDEFQLLMLELMTRPVAFHPALARAAGSAAAGLFLSQLFYWHEKGRHPDGWIYKDHKEWTDETYLTQDEQRGARKALEKQRIIEVSDVRRLGIDKYKSTLAFRINFEQLQKCILNANGSQTRVVDGDGNIPSREAENPIPEAGKSHPGVGFSASLYSESTAETSSKSSSSSAASPFQEKKRRRRASGIITWTRDDAALAEELEFEFDESQIAAAVEFLVRAGQQPLPGLVQQQLEAAAAAATSEEAARQRREESERAAASHLAAAKAAGVCLPAISALAQKLTRARGAAARSA